MSAEKLIEEIAITMLEASTTANVEPVLDMEGKEVVLGENATKILNTILEQAYIPFLAEVIYNADYRKASEVAREIFEEIEKARKHWDTVYDNDHFDDHFGYNGSAFGYLENDVDHTIYELKKKYTEENKSEM